MEENTTIRCPHTRILRSVEWNEERAKFLVSTGKSGDNIIDWSLKMLREHSEYTLIGPNGSVFDPNAYDPRVLEILDNMFGNEDQKRGVNRYKARANGSFQNRLCKKLVPSVMCLYFAEQILLHELAKEANANA